MRFIKHTVMLTLALSFIWAVQGCHSGDKNKEDVQVELTIRSQTVSSNAGSQFIMVNTPGAWTITSNQSWATVEPSSGTGSYSKIVLTCLENPSEQSRVALITLTAAGKTSEITLIQAGIGGNVDPDIPDPDDPTGGKTHATYGWLELPAFNTSTYKFVTHELASSGHSGRSFSYLWSKGDLVALWVAYPLNKSLISTGSRTDYWATDPKLTTEEQPILYNAYKGGYDRGHQLPSADRLAYNDNKKTFYFTNMTPQLNSLNGYLWATLESQVRSWGNKSDTLYVVTGCVVNGSTKKAYDNNGKAVTVPVAYYKAILRYMSNSTVGHSGYLALGIYLEHRAYSEKTISKSMCMSIDDLEKKLNIDLFPNLINKVGEDTANTIEAENPANVSWWWN